MDHLLADSEAAIIRATVDNDTRSSVVATYWDAWDRVHLTRAAALSAARLAAELAVRGHRVSEGT